MQGFVASTGDFREHPQVINGVSDLLVEVLGKEVGGHSRFAVGCSSLPLGVPVEVGAVIEIEPLESYGPTAMGFYGVDPKVKLQPLGLVYRLSTWQEDDGGVQGGSQV